MALGLKDGNSNNKAAAVSVEQKNKVKSKSSKTIEEEELKKIIEGIPEQRKLSFREELEKARIWGLKMDKKRRIDE